MPLSTIRRLHTREEPFLVYADSDGALNDVDLTDAVGVTFENAQPIRTFPVYKGKRHHDGSHFFLPTGSLIGYESDLEEQAMLWFEYIGATGLSAQPFAIEWPRGHKPRRHVPDLFVRHGDCTGEVVDVRPPHRADDPVFHATQEVCTEAGLHYSVFTGIAETVTKPSPVWAQTFAVLSAYRAPRYAPPDVEPFLHAFATGRALHRGVYSVTQHVGQDKGTVLSQTYHLLWRRRLVLDPHERLAGTSWVTVA